MIPVDIWQGIDYLAFHENAILLDVKSRSHGKPIRSAIEDQNQVESRDGLTPHIVRNVLDDFALLVSGHGGKGSVSAVCMEHDESLRIFTFRISSNDGIPASKLVDLERILRSITKDPGTERQREDVLALILRQCSTVFLKHVNKFLNELKEARCPRDKDLCFPIFSIQQRNFESAMDLDHLGPYNGESHHAYMQLSSERLCTLRRLSTELIAAETQLDFSKMGLLTKAAYNVQRSSSFDQFVRHNLLASQKATAVQSMAQQLKERLGKISRVWRAAKTLAAFGSAMVAHHGTINILCLPASRQMVGALRGRTLAQLQSRGGRNFQSCNAGQLLEKLSKWHRYRLHCEMQLIIFYQENPHLQLRSRYIGCNKLACFMCYNFINNHGRFQVKGCHQGLYSLWTVPLSIAFDSQERAGEFSSALRQLARILASRVEMIGKASKSQWKYRTNPESTANISRISLEWPSMTGAIAGATKDTYVTGILDPSSCLADSSESHDYHSKVGTSSPTYGLQTGLAIELCQHGALDLVTSPVARTEEAWGNTENDLDEQSSWELDTTVPVLTECKTEITAPASGSQLSHIEAGRINASSAKPSQQVRRSFSISRSGLVRSVVAERAVSKDDNEDSQHRGTQVEGASLPAPSISKVRRFSDLSYEQNAHSAHIIGDHESRTSDTPYKYGIQEQPAGQSSMPSLYGVCRTFDFHDMGLFLEVDGPESARITVNLCSKPAASAASPIIVVDDMEPGETLEIDLGQDFSRSRAIVLTMHDSKRIDPWWECRWENCEDEEGMDLS